MSIPGSTNFEIKIEQIRNANTDPRIIDALTYLIIINPKQDLEGLKKRTKEGTPNTYGLVKTWEISLDTQEEYLRAEQEELDLKKKEILLRQKEQEKALQEKLAALKLDSQRKKEESKLRKKTEKRNEINKEVNKLEIKVEKLEIEISIREIEIIALNNKSEYNQHCSKSFNDIIENLNNMFAGPNFDAIVALCWQIYKLDQFEFSRKFDKLVKSKILHQRAQPNKRFYKTYLPMGTDSALEIQDLVESLADLGLGAPEGLRNGIKLIFAKNGDFDLIDFCKKTVEMHKVIANFYGKIVTEEKISLARDRALLVSCKDRLQELNLIKL